MIYRSMQPHLNPIITLHNLKLAGPLYGYVVLGGVLINKLVDLLVFLALLPLHCCGVGWGGGGGGGGGIITSWYAHVMVCCSQHMFVMLRLG